MEYIPKWGTRYFPYVPERDAFIMAYDLDHPQPEWEWRGIGGKQNPGDPSPIHTGDREHDEETGVNVQAYEKTPFRTFTNSRGLLIYPYLVIVPESEARWMRPRGNDVPGLLIRPHIMAGTYREIPLNRRYRKIILDEVLPIVDAIFGTAHA